MWRRRGKGILKWFWKVVSKLSECGLEICLCLSSITGWACLAWPLRAQHGAVLARVQIPLGLDHSRIDGSICENSYSVLFWVFFCTFFGIDPAQLPTNKSWRRACLRRINWGYLLIMAASEIALRDMLIDAMVVDRMCHYNTNSDQLLLTWCDHSFGNFQSQWTPKSSPVSACTNFQNFMIQWQFSTSGMVFNRTANYAQIQNRTRYLFSTRQAAKKYILNRSFLIARMNSKNRLLDSSRTKNVFLVRSKLATSRLEAIPKSGLLRLVAITGGLVTPIPFGSFRLTWIEATDSSPRKSPRKFV